MVVNRGARDVQLSYDHVFQPDVSQEQVYDSVRESVKAVLVGINSTIFAYGQTGTGKTFTMLGGSVEDDFSYFDMQGEYLEDSRGGIIPRSVADIFDFVDKHRDRIEFTVYCSYLEIYKERIYDLLQLGNIDRFGQRPGLEIREEKNKGLFVQDLTEVHVTSVSEIFSLMKLGQQVRQVAATHMNEYSSRSHTIFQLFVEQRPLYSKENVVLKAKLNLVDLAGSEKWKTSIDMKEQRISELTHINKSLSTLGNCIAALTQRGRQHVPYRDSKLTRLLQDSLGGNTRTMFIATISPALRSIEETMSTLKFADRAKRIVLSTRVNESVDKDVLISRYEREIIRLREQLRAGGNGTMHNNKSGESSSGESAGNGSGVVGNAAWDQRVQELDEENMRLKEEINRMNMWLYQEREERRRLLQVFKKTLGLLKNVKKPGETASVETGGLTAEIEMLQVQNHFLQVKLSQLESSDYDQQARQAELDDYYKWLHSIKVNFDENQYSISVRDRLALMERSVLLQAQELQRTKKLFLHEMQVAQGELQGKCQELASAERREEEIKKKFVELSRLIARLKQESAGGAMPRLSSAVSDDGSDARSPLSEKIVSPTAAGNPYPLVERDTLAASANASSSSVPRSPMVYDDSVLRSYVGSLTLEEQKMSEDLEYCMQSFRKNISNALDMVLKQPSVGAEVTTKLKDHTLVVVLGCLDALKSYMDQMRSESLSRLKGGFRDVESQVLLLQREKATTALMKKALPATDLETGMIALITSVRAAVTDAVEVIGVLDARAASRLQKLLLEISELEESAVSELTDNVRRKEASGNTPLSSPVSKGRSGSFRESSQTPTGVKSPSRSRSRSAQSARTVLPKKQSFSQPFPEYFSSPRES